MEEKLTCKFCGQLVLGESWEEASSLLIDHLEIEHPGHEAKRVIKEILDQAKERQRTQRRLPAIYEASTGEMVKGELRLAAIEYAKRVGLKPELGHICLYYGRPWVTIDGWYYRFRRAFPDGKVVTRPLSSNERLDSQLDDHVIGWKAEVYAKDGGELLAVGYGYASKSEEPLAKGSAVEPRWPGRLAEKRAEEDALRKVVPLELEATAGTG